MSFLMRLKPSLLTYLPSPTMEDGCRRAAADASSLAEAEVPAAAAFFPAPAAASETASVSVKVAVPMPLLPAPWMPLPLLLAPRMLLMLLPAFRVSLAGDAAASAVEEERCAASARSLRLMLAPWTLGRCRAAGTARYGEGALGRGAEPVARPAG